MLLPVLTYSSVCYFHAAPSGGLIVGARCSCPTFQPHELNIKGGYSTLPMDFALS